MSLLDQMIALLLAVGVYFLTPVALIWGWVRWTRQPRQKTPLAILSLTGFTLASASGVLAIIAWVWALFLAFPFYDPRLLRLFRWGCLLSLSGIVFAIGGVWRRSALRWHAAATSVGTLLF